MVVFFCQTNVRNFYSLYYRNKIKEDKGMTLIGTFLLNNKKIKEQFKGDTLMECIEKFDNFIDENADKNELKVLYCELD